MRAPMRRSIAVSVWSVCSLVALGGPNLVRAQSTDKLGTISFPNSGNAAAQAPFLRGMKLYYSFEYGPAATAFQEAQKADPSFTLAYVGEALTHTHQVWNQQNVGAARAALAKLAPNATQRLSMAKTPRERMYGELVEILYGDGSKARRDTLFTDAAERIARAHPNDDEAKMLQALGLLGLNQSVRDFPTYMRAGALAEEVLRRNPDHPAAAHYIIHAFDDPIHAPLGLWAARAYSKIAAGAPHAVHMTSHIYVALGMWDDVIEQNQVAAGHDHANYTAGHYTLWLGYGYLQAGRLNDAMAHIETMGRNFSKTQRAPEANALAMLLGHYYVDAGGTIDNAAWKLPPPATMNAAAATSAFVAGLVAIREKDAKGATAAVDRLDEGAKSGAPAGRDAIAVLAKELRAEIASAAGRHDEAIALARSASEAEEGMPYEYGPPQFVKPTHELLGEVLLAAGKHGEAKTAFQRSLARTPGRARSLVGLARAAAGAGDKATMDAAVAALKANWHASDKNLPELAELTKLVASSSK